MELCKNNHEEVAFVSSWKDDCPACLYAEQVREELQDQIDKLQTEKDELQEEFDEMDANMEELRQQYLDE